MRSTFILIVAFCIAGYTNGAKASSQDTPSAAKKGKRAKSQGMALDAFIQKLIVGGSDYTIGKSVAIDYGFEDAIPTRADEVPDLESDDNTTHTAYALVAKSADSEASKATWLLFSTKHKTNSQATSLHFKLLPNGTLEKAYVTEFKYDGEGKPVHGSAVTTDMDCKTAKVKTQLKHELDFWLKGMYRKQPKSTSNN